MQVRNVYFVSDGTGLTAANLGHSLLTQFEQIQFNKVTVPYVDNVLKAWEAVTQINRDFKETKIKPIVFTTLIDLEIVDIFAKCQGLVLNLFQTFIGELEFEFALKSSHSIGRTHAAYTAGPVG